MVLLEADSRAQVEAVLVVLQTRQHQQRTKDKMELSTTYSVLMALIPHSSNLILTVASTLRRQTMVSQQTLTEYLELVSSPSTRSRSPSPAIHSCTFY